MNDEFRRRAKDDFARLLAHWRRIEYWIKRGEQINKKAMIPAINELRYASRQLFNALRIFDKDALTQGDESIIRRRIVIAEQYLFNAEHDIADAIVGFYSEVTETLDLELGPTSITTRFPQYPLLKERLVECNSLVSEARQDYEKRAQNYGRLREAHFPYLVEIYARLLEAEVGAREAKESLERQLRIAGTKITILGWLSAVGSVATLLSIPLAIFLWVLAHDQYCARYATKPIVGLVCSPPASR